MEKYKKKVGILGGTFNPIHLGHLLLAETAKETFLLDEIMFIPSGHPYLKANKDVADKKMRLEMTRLAISSNPEFSLSSMEVEREGNTYTFETLLELKRQHPNTAFYFIMGADSLYNLDLWKHPEIICSNCVILAAVRDNKKPKDLKAQIEFLEEKYLAKIKLLPLKEITISSTDIRNRMKEKKSIRYMVPDKVIDYIIENHVYD